MRFTHTTDDSIHATNITTIKNEYTETELLKKKMQQDIDKKTKRRMFTLVAIGAFVLIPMGKQVVDNVTEIQAMDSKIETAKAEKKELAAENQNLEVTVGLLQDDDYIAKLARSRYYLSKSGEIIFSLPEDNSSKTAEE